MLLMFLLGFITGGLVVTGAAFWHAYKAGIGLFHRDLNTTHAPAGNLRPDPSHADGR